MSKQRVENPEQEKLLKKTLQEEKRKARQDAIAKQKGKGGDAISGEKMPKWKADRQQFLNELKAGKELEKCKEKGLPLPPVVASAPDPTLVPCPHCNRRFNEKAAERHIPVCNSIKAQPKSLKRGGGLGCAAGVSGSSGKGGFNSTGGSKPSAPSKTKRKL